MSLLSTDAAFSQLRDHYSSTKLVLNDLFRQNPKRFSLYSRTVTFGDINLLFDFSKNLFDDKSFHLLLQLVDSREVIKARDEMFSGKKINFTENRSVLHVALRDINNRGNYKIDDTPVYPEISKVLKHMEEFSESVISGKWKGFSGKAVTDVVNIGIGGSDLGPYMVTEALKGYQIGPNVHFVSNIDGIHIKSTLSKLNPETTLFIVASKTFTTQETLTNAFTARKWLLNHYNNSKEATKKHFVALSTNSEKVSEFGIDPSNMFEFWEWVGGRYSVWSAIGLSVCLHVGMNTFSDFLAGANAVDEHFKTAPPNLNIPILMAMVGVWNSSVMNLPTHAVLPYNQYLHRLPAYLQQADMESNGKTVCRSGESVDYPTGAIVWGEPGTNGQHSFYQLIHQGTHIIPADFIGFAQPNEIHDDPQHHNILLCNFLAQTEGLMTGRTIEEVKAELRCNNKLSDEEVNQLAPHKVFTGNRPSTSFVFSRYSARSLGSLIALYEHKIFVEGVIWGINSFDQYGVELGKVLAKNLEGEMAGNDPSESGHDSSTLGLINFIKQNRNN